MKPPLIFAFTDCKDPNALTRLTARLLSLFPDSPVHAVGIDSDIEAAGCILDTLDALRLSDTPSIIIGNLAPRADKHYKNGAPFYVGYIGSTILVATKTCFSLLAKFNLIEKIEETDVETVCMKFLPEAEALRIANSQFRSFEYVPRLAYWAQNKKDIPRVESEVTPLPHNQIWWVDNFGNCKTTIIEDELSKKIVNNTVTLSINDKEQTFTFYKKLADVPTGEFSIIIGSSGYDTTRFAEIVKQGASASKELEIVPGSKLEF